MKKMKIEKGVILCRFITTSHASYIRHCYYEKYWLQPLQINVKCRVIQLKPAKHGYILTTVWTQMCRKHTEYKWILERSVNVTYTWCNCKCVYWGWGAAGVHGLPFGFCFCFVLFLCFVFYVDMRCANQCTLAWIWYM